MSVSLKQSYDIEYDGTANVARMDLFADTAGDLTGLTTVDGITLLQGSTAHVIQTVEDYMMRSNGVWVLQTAGGGGGGGGGDTPVFYTPTAASGISYTYASLVKIGTKVSFVGRVDLSANTSGDKTLFTVPAEVTPLIKYISKCGTNSSSSDDTCYILPNGEFHVVLAQSKNYAQWSITWDVITPTYFPTVDTNNVSDFTGGIQLIENMAILQVSLTLQNVSTGWKSGIITIPAEVCPANTQSPFGLYRSRNGAPYPDVFVNTNGSTDIYLNTSYGNIIDLSCVWEL